MLPVHSSFPFLEREQELRTLTRFYQAQPQDGASFMFLYGRPGVGKTRLLDELRRLQKPKHVFYWQALDTDSPTQLVGFVQAWSDYISHNGGSERTKPVYDWDTALKQFASDIRCFTEPHLVIIENFTGLCHQKTALSSLWKKAWDMELQYLPHLRLILTGNCLTTMVREVLAYSAPFYLRAQYHLHLRPLRYETLISLFPQFTTEERMLIYAVTGGTPLYLQPFVAAATVRDGLKALLYGPESSFIEDVTTLFDERLDDRDLCQKLLTGIVAGHQDFERLVTYTDASKESVDRALWMLRLIRFVDENPSVGDPSFSIRVRYGVSEHPLRFYYEHLQPILAQELSTDAAADLLLARLHQSLGQHPFLFLCHEWLWAADITGRLNLDLQRTGAYWQKSTRRSSFPVGGVDQEGQKLIVGLTVWDNETVKPNLIRQLAQKSQRLPQVRRGWTVQPVLFGRKPFSKAVGQIASASNVQLVTLAEIEPLLQAARAEIIASWSRPLPDIPF